ncbi:MAG TPA: hypothetical protein VGI39_02875, partial [Polyangiaceae bacterium]
PQRASADVRCAYWTKRVEEAGTSHLMAVFSYPPEYFRNLHSWADARKNDACAEAKKEADASEAARLDGERARELAEAQRAHEARDREAWEQAKVESCRAADREDACGGVRSYVEAFGSGGHAVEAREALHASEPKLAELRRLREEAEERRAAGIAKREEAAGVKISSLQASFEEARRGTSVRLRFDATLLRAMDGKGLAIRVACRAGEKRIVDAVTLADALAGDLAAGDTRELEVEAFSRVPLRERPEHCDVVMRKPGGGDVDMFCVGPAGGLARQEGCE